jgi:hypothetical protein
MLVMHGKKMVDVRSLSIETRKVEISEGSFRGVDILKLIVARY